MSDEEKTMLINILFEIESSLTEFNPFSAKGLYEKISDLNMKFAMAEADDDK